MSKTDASTPRAGDKSAHKNNPRGEDKAKGIEEAKKIIAKENKPIIVEKRFKERGNRGKGKVYPEEKAEMIKSLMEKPGMTGKEFAKKFGYALNEEGQATQGAYVMMRSLKEVVAGYDIPEMEDLVKADLISCALAQREVIRRLDEDSENISVGELVNVSNSSFKRARLLSGASTENISIRIEDTKDMKEEDLDRILTEMVTVKEVKK